MQNAKTLLAIMLVWLLTPIALASTPQYSVYDNINTTIQNINQDVGKIIITKNAPLPEIHELTTIQDFTIQAHDILLWKGANTLQINRQSGITETILPPGGSHLITNSGAYKLLLLSNASIHADLFVEPEDNLNVMLTSQKNHVQLTINPGASIIMTERVFNIRANVSPTLPPGEYQETIDIKTDFDSQKIIKKFTVQENKNFTLTNRTLPHIIEAQSGDFKRIGKLSFENIGNTEYSIKMELIGNATQFLTYQDELAAFTGITTPFNFVLQVPETTPDGIYTSKIIASNNKIEKEYNITIIVRDKTPPTIQNITFLDDRVWVNNRVKLTTKDNLMVTRATITYNNHSHDMLIDAQTFTYNTIFRNISEYEFVFCAYDAANNSACNNITKQFTILDILDSHTKQVMPTKKTNTYSSTVIMRLNETPIEPIQILLESVSFTSYNKSKGLEGINIRIQEEDGTILIFNNINTTLKVQHPGEIRIEVKTDTVTNYEVILKILTPYYMVSEPRIIIVGKSVLYEVPEPFTKEWYGVDGGIKCEPHDTGTVDDSYIICTTKYPITTNIEDFSVPITLEQKQLQETNFNATLMNKQKEINVMSGLLLTSIIFFVVSGLLAYYYARIKPLIKFKYYGKIKDKRGT